MNNKSIALNILQINEQNISQYHKSKFKKIREKQVILLIITDGQKHHYLTLKKLNVLLKKNQTIVEIIV